MSTHETPADELPELWLRIIEAIAGGATAWSAPDAVASAIGLDEDATCDALASMDVDGLIDVWELPEGIAVTLSVLGADRFGYRLVEDDGPRGLRWASLEEPDPRPLRAFRVVRSASIEQMEALVDPRPAPDLAAEQSEAANRFLANGPFGTLRRGAGKGEPPRPTLLIGGGSGTRPTVVDDPRDACPACGGRRLPANAYCLGCDRWGLDAPPQNAPGPRGHARGPKHAPDRSRDDRRAFSSPEHRASPGHGGASARLRGERAPHRRRGRLFVRRPRSGEGAA